MKPTLITFAKAPRMGVSKTRLAAGIGAARAWRVKRTLDAFTCRVAQSPKWRTILAVGNAHDVRAAFPGAWPSALPRIPQGRGDLGKRMAGAMRAYGHGPVCIIGTDLPDLRTSDINAAFQALRRHDVVIGPATDGGYWLIGLSARAARRANFDHVRWSTRHTRADTLATLPKTWRVALLREMEDVDDAASFKRSRRRQTSR
jgi:uncharacterized protein